MGADQLDCRCRSRSLRLPRRCRPHCATLRRHRGCGLCRGQYDSRKIQCRSRKLQCPGKRRLHNQRNWFRMDELNLSEDESDHAETRDNCCELTNCLRKMQWGASTTWKRPIALLLVLSHSGSVTVPFTLKLPVTTCAPVFGCPPPTDTAYAPSATIGSPASVTMLMSRGLSSNFTFCDASAAM